MEELKKLNWLPNVEDIVDNEFVTEENYEKFSATWKILNGVFQDPFAEIRPRNYKKSPDPKQKKAKEQGKGKEQETAKEQEKAKEQVKAKEQDKPDFPQNSQNKRKRGGRRKVNVKL